MNLVLKNIGNQGIDNNDKSSSFGKDNLLEIFHYSGLRFGLSVCKKDIKIIKYIEDANKIDINKAKILSEQGIDMFNLKDNFFNDICYPNDNPNKKDIIINYRKDDIFQNITFCQDACKYDGINYFKLW